MGFAAYATVVVLVMIIVFLKFLASRVPYGMDSFIAALKSVSRGALGLGVAIAGFIFLVSKDRPKQNGGGGS